MCMCVHVCAHVCVCICMHAGVHKYRRLTGSWFLMLAHPTRLNYLIPISLRPLSCMSLTYHCLLE
jgi:hypothetical protein